MKFFLITIQWKRNLRKNEYQSRFQNVYKRIAMFQILICYNYDTQKLQNYHISKSKLFDNRVWSLVTLAVRKKKQEPWVLPNNSTSPTGSRNQLASFRFQNTFRLNVWNRNGIDDFRIQLVKYWTTKISEKLRYINILIYIFITP